MSINTWPALVVMTLLVRKLLKEEFVLWAIFSGIFGLLFGAFFAVAYILSISHMMLY
mgnify:CR=1 FL=1